MSVASSSGFPRVSSNRFHRDSNDRILCECSVCPGDFLRDIPGCQSRLAVSRKEEHRTIGRGVIPGEGCVFNLRCVRQHVCGIGVGLLTVGCDGSTRHEIRLDLNLAVSRLGENTSTGICNNLQCFFVFHSRNRVVRVELLQTWVDIILGNPSVLQNLLCQCVVAFTSGTIQTLHILAVHITENVLATDCSRVIVTFPFRTPQVVSLNPLDSVRTRGLITVHNIHFLSCLEVVDSRVRVIHIEVVVVVFQRYRKIELRNISPDRLLPRRVSF